MIKDIKIINNPTKGKLLTDNKIMWYFIDHTNISQTQKDLMEKRIDANVLWIQKHGGTK